MSDRPRPAGKLSIDMNKPDAVWMFDVDGTLIGSIRSDVLRPQTLTLLRKLQARGTKLVLWSAGGADYARRMLAQFGLDQVFCGFYDKARRGPDGRYLIDHIPRDHWPGTLIDDFPDEIPLAPQVIRVRQFLGNNLNDRGLNQAIQLAER